MKRKRTFHLGLIVVALLAVICIIDGGSVSAQDDVGLSFENKSTGFCLDSNTKRQVYTKKCNDGNFQDWILTYNDDDKTVTLENDATGFCLDSNTKRQVYTKKCNDGSFQRWYLTNDTGNVFKNKATGFCLDSNAKRNVYTHDCNTGDFQRWRTR